MRQVRAKLEMNYPAASNGVSIGKFRITPRGGELNSCPPIFGGLKSAKEGVAMKKLYLVFLILIVSTFAAGCVAKKIEPNTLKSPDERALYDLMLARCQALNAKDMNLFREIYTKDSPELGWIENTGIPLWKQNGMNFKDPLLKRISMVGKDAAASFVLNGNNSSGTSFVYRVEVLYVKEGSQWKIESTGAR
jgi:hypothetical protein